MRLVLITPASSPMMKAPERRIALVAESHVRLMTADLRAVAIYRGQGHVDNRSDRYEIDAEPAIPGFRCAAADLFPSLA